MPVSATSKWDTLTQVINGLTVRDDHACVSVHPDSIVIGISTGILASSMCSGTAGKARFPSSSLDGSCLGIKLMCGCWRKMGKEDKGLTDEMKDPESSASWGKV